jgi:hypothetical protein
LSFSVLIRQSFILTVKSSNLIGIRAIILAELTVEVLDFLQNLGTLLFEYVIFPCELVDSLFNLIEFIGELANLAG